MRELLSKYLRGYRGRVTVGMAVKVVEVVFDLMTPMIVARMIDVGVAHHDARYVLYAHYIEGATYQQVAAALGRSLRHVYRARRRGLDSLGGEGAGDAGG